MVSEGLGSQKQSLAKALACFRTMSQQPNPWNPAWSEGIRASINQIIKYPQFKDAVNFQVEQISKFSQVGSAFKYRRGGELIEPGSLTKANLYKFDIDTSGLAGSLMKTFPNPMVSGFASSGGLVSVAERRPVEQVPKSTYSQDMTHPGSYFEADEVVVTSFAELITGINKLSQKADGLQLLWRGQQDARWGVHSSLFRELMARNGVKRPEEGACGEQPYPTEDQMVNAEGTLLKIARHHWRMDGSAALEIFARIQHAGGLSRLLDVTFNPLIAAWFACEHHEETNDKDARVFAFATQAPAEDGNSAPAEPVVLGSMWGNYTPVWFEWDDAARRDSEWGTGDLRRWWVPPTYDPRISGQQAAFLIDGVPLPMPEGVGFKSPTGKWTRADMLAAGSFYMRTQNPTRKLKPRQPNVAPVFTFRITAGAKEEVRRMLTDRYGYTAATIYPDIAGLAQEVRRCELPALG